MMSAERGRTGVEEGEDSDSWSEGVGEGEEDDETTLNEEEGQGQGAEEDYEDELEDLQKEGDLPIEELLKMYGYGGEGGGVHSPSPASDTAPSSSSTGRKRPRERNSGESKPTQEEIQLPDSTELGPNEAEPSSGPIDNGPEPKKSALEYLYEREEGEDSEEDDDYVPPEVWKKEIRVGQEYQADVPEVSAASEKGDIVPTEDSTARQQELDRLLWKPSVLDDSKVESYLTKIFTISPGKANGEAESGSGVSQNGPSAPGSLRDDEDALYLLLKEDMDSSKAADRYQEMMEKVPGVLEARSVIGPSPDIRLEAIQERMDKSAGQSVSSTWSEQDCTSFEEGLRNFGKHFHSIRNQFLPHKSVRELVQFYYSWKKTERHDLFVQRVRFEKKQFSLNPNATDYMDHVLDQMDLYSQNLQGGLPLPHHLPVQSSMDPPPHVPSLRHGSDPSGKVLPPSLESGDNNGSGLPMGEGSVPLQNQMLLSPTSSGLLINSDPKHAVGKFHGTHFNEWPTQNPASRPDEASISSGVGSSVDILPTDPGESGWPKAGNPSKPDEFSLPVPTDPTDSQVSSTQGVPNLLPQLAPEAIDQLLDA